MQNLINFDDVNTKITTIRNQNVILDSDVATLYGVQTKEVNQAIRNNPKKFPEGYVLEISREESLRSKILTLNKQGRGQHKKYLPNALTEKGLYMLATILKSERAVEATIAIVETFAKLKQLSNKIAFLNSIDPEIIEPEVIESTVEKTGGLLNELFFSAVPISAETSLEFNLGFMKGKRTVKSDGTDIAKMQNKIDKLEQTIESMSRQIEKMSEK